MAVSIKDQLREVLSEMGVATRDDVKTIVRETITEMDIPNRKQAKKIVEDVFHEQITEYHSDMIMPELSKLEQKDNKIIDFLKILKDTTDRLKTNISFIKSDIRDLKAELSLTVSRREFEKFKAQVLRN